MLDLLELDTTVVIIESSLQGKSATYQVTIRNLIQQYYYTGQLFQKKLFKSLPQTPKLLKVCTHKVMTDSGAHLGPVGQYDLTFRLGNKQFTDTFISLQDQQEI